MYLKHFALREFPFSITPDTSFFFASGASQEALNTLLVAARMGEGFIKITGEVGTGKTLLCRKLITSLGPDFYVAFLPNPLLDPEGLFTAIASELGIEAAQGTSEQRRHELLRRLNERLIQLGEDGKRVLVCLDEAQAMPVETMEALRLLTNLETEKRKLLQVVIFGQPELESKLNHPSIRQLKQRITFHYHLGPLTKSELAYYLHHRLVVAGYAGGQVFSRLACWALERVTGGIPRLVNIIAHKSLLSAFGRGKREVGLSDVLAAAADTASVGVRNPLRPLILYLGLFAVTVIGTLSWMAVR